MKFLLNTTTWENNSALAAIGYALTQKILTNNSQKSLSVPTLNKLQDAFASYYQLPHFNLSMLRQLFEYYLHPEDQQKLVVGPLKEILTKAVASSDKKLILADEMSLLCRELKISLEIYDPDFKRINPSCKGYERSHPFCHLEVVASASHVYPSTESMSEVFRQQLVWKHGFRYFTHQSASAIAHDVRSLLSAPRERVKAAGLHKAMINQSYNQIAALSKAEANNSNPDNGFYSIIDKAVGSKDFSTLLTIYYFKPSTRNAILLKTLSKQSTAFVTDFLKFYNLLPRDGAQTNNWSNELNKVLPCVERTSGDIKLHTAIRTKDVITAKKLIDDGEDIYQPNDNDVSSLHLACVLEDQYLIQAMMDKEEDKNRQKGFLRYLTYTGIDLSQQDQSGNTPLHYAAGAKDPHFVEFLLKQYVPIVRRPFNFHKKNNQGRTPIHIAALNPNAKILQQFLTQKHQFPGHHDQDDLGLTPLHYAAAAKNRENIRLLLSAGASLTTVADADKIKEQFPQCNSNLSYLTPLWISLEVEDLESAALLVTNANHLSNTRNSQGLNALQLAARLGRIDLLTAWNKQFNHSNLLCSPDDNSQRLIHHAAMAGRVDVVKYLISQGEWPTRPDHRGNTPLHFAAQHGHVELVQFLCDEAQKEREHNARLAKQGMVKEFLQKKRIMIQVDGENSFAETPHLLAQIHGHHEIAKMLERAGAKPISLSDYLIKAIYRRTSDDMSKSEYKAACIVAKRHTMALETDADLNTFLHHAVQSGNYRAVLILLHPLKPEQRKALVLAKNRKGQTTLALLDQIKRNAKDSQQKRTLDKIERALIRYDDEAFAKKYPSAMQESRYREQFGEDFQEELEQTAAYYYVSSASLYVPMVLDGISKAASATNPFFAPFAFGVGVFESFFGGDVLDNTERSLSFFAQRNPTFYPGAVSMASNVLSGFGWYRHTTRRFAVTVVKKVSARILSLAALENYHSESKNFIDYINWLGLIHAGTEEVGRKKIANSLVEYWESYESSLEKIGVPKVNDVVLRAAGSINETVKELSGFDIEQTVRRIYGCLREKVGSLPSVGAELLKVIDTEIMHDLGLDNATQQEAIKKLFEVTIEEFRHEPKKLEQVITGLRGYILTGEVLAEMLPLLSQTSQRLTNEEAGTLLASLVIAGPLYKHELLNDLDRVVLKTHIADEVNSGKLSEMFDKATAKRIELLGQHVIAEQCLPLMGTQNSIVRDYLQQGLQALYVNSFNEEKVFENDFNAVSLYLSHGVLTRDIAKSMDRLADALVVAGKNYGEVIHALTMQNGFYQSFQGDVKLATYSNRLQNSLAALQSVDASERGDKLYAALVKEHQYVIDSAVQSLQSGLSVYTQYKSILDQNGIRPCADGLAEYAAQILVFNNRLSFGDLTYAQKQQMQAFYRAYFNEMQGGGSKVDKGAVKKNFDRAQTFQLVAPYVELILTGAPVDANIPGIFAQWDPMVVRAAVAAHEVAAMVNTTQGYSALNNQQTFNLFRKFYDQQFASSTTKVEQGMLDIVNETLRAQDQTGGQFTSIWGQHTIDSAAQFVSSSSKQIAENRWQGTGDVYARSIGNNNKGKVHRFFSSFEKDARQGFKKGAQGSTLGGTTTGSTHRPTFFHTPSGTETALNFSTTGKGLTFEMPPKAAPEPLGKVVVNRTSKPREDTQIVVNGTSKPRQDTQTPIYTPSWAAQAKDNRTPIFTPLLAANDVRPNLAVLPSEPVGKVVSKKDSHVFSVREAERRERESAVAMLLATPQSKGAQVKLLPELTEPLLTLPVVDRVVPTPAKLSLGDRLLSMIGIGRAEANLVAIAGAAIAGATAIGAIMKPHQQDDRRGSNSRDEERRLTSPSYTGLLPNRDEIEVESTSFPAVSSGGHKTQTLLNQPGLKSLVLTTPYFGLKKLQNVYNRNTQQESPGIYDHDYPKHQAKPGGGGSLWGDKASLNPIPDKTVGQNLLDTSYASSGNSKERFNYYDDKIIKFRSSNDGKWHSYEVEKGVRKQVGDKVLKQFLKDELITKSEYKKLLKK